MQRLRNRREFVRDVTALTSACAFGAQSAIAQTDSERVELGLHPYSLRPLFESGRIDVLSYPEFCKARLGLTNIEYDVGDLAEYDAQPERAKAIRRRADDAGTRIRTLLAGAEPALDAATEMGRRNARDTMLRWVEVAEILGCDFIRLRAGTSGPREENLKWAVDGLGAFAESLKDRKVAPLVENIQGHSRDPDWLIALGRGIGWERLGLLGDFGNFDGDLYEGMRKLAPRCRELCSKSWEFDASGEETTIDFGKMGRVIRESGFQGLVAMEYLGETGSPVDGVKKTAGLLRRSLG